MAFTFGQKLAAVRKARGLTKASLANRCRFARSTIERYERDLMDVSSAHARTLGRVLQVTAGYFITDDDQRDSMTMEELLSIESLKCFCQVQTTATADRAHLERIAGHGSSPNTIEGWQAILTLAKDGLLLFPADENSTRTDREEMAPKLAVVPKNAFTTEPPK